MSPSSPVRIPSPPPPSSSQEDLTAHLTLLCHAIKDLINVHMTDPTHPSWIALTSPGFKHYGTVFQPSGPSATNTEAVCMDLPAYLQSVSDMVEEYPNYRITIVDSSTAASLKKGSARTFANMEIGGAPEGVVRRVVTEVEWSKTGEEDRGRWVAVWTKSLAGFGGGFG